MVSHGSRFLTHPETHSYLQPEKIFCKASLARTQSVSSVLAGGHYRAAMPPHRLLASHSSNLRFPQKQREQSIFELVPIWLMFASTPAIKPSYFFNFANCPAALSPATYFQSPCSQLPQRAQSGQRIVNYLCNNSQQFDECLLAFVQQTNVRRYPRSLCALSPLVFNPSSFGSQLQVHFHVNGPEDSSINVVRRLGIINWNDGQTNRSTGQYLAGSGKLNRAYLTFRNYHLGVPILLVITATDYHPVVSEN